MQKNTQIKYKTEYTGFEVRMTIAPERIASDVKIKNTDLGSKNMSLIKEFLPSIVVNKCSINCLP